MLYCVSKAPVSFFPGLVGLLSFFLILLLQEVDDLILPHMGVGSDEWEDVFFADEEEQELPQEVDVAPQQPWAVRRRQPCPPSYSSSGSVGSRPGIHDQVDFLAQFHIRYVSSHE